MTTARPAAPGGPFALYRTIHTRPHMRDDNGNRPVRPVRTYAGLDAACKRKDGIPHSGGWFEPDYRIPRDGSTAF